MNKILSFIVIVLAFCPTIMGQKLEVISMRGMTMDMSAATNQRLDLNGRPCGLVKVSVTLTNVTFGGSVIGKVDRDGSDYWVYQPEGTKTLQIKHPNFKNIIVSFPGLGVPRIESKMTYVMDIEVPAVMYAAQPEVTHTSVKSSTTSNTALTPASNTTTPTYNDKIKDYLCAFFPVDGLTIGKTTYAEVHDIEGLHGDCIHRPGIVWTIDRERNLVSSLCIEEFPSSWKNQFGFDKSWSYNQWYNALLSLGFRIDIEKEPKVVKYNGEDALSAEFRATAPNGHFYFHLRFDGGKDGISVDSPNTLHKYGFIATSTINKSIEKLLLTSKNKTYNKKLSADISTFFPVYGITLGKSTWYDVANAGHFVEEVSKGSSIICNTMGFCLFDHNRKGYFNELYITSGGNMPTDWQKLGFQWGNSYQTWLDLLDQMGYKVTVTKAPTVRSYNGRDVLNAEFVAVSPDGTLKMEFNFDGGYSANTTGPKTLYSIKMTAL